MGLVTSQKIGLAAFALMFGEGCTDEIPRTSLAELGARDDVRVEPVVATGVCRCRCENTMCWSFTCTAGSCSESDEHTLRLSHGSDSGTSECLPSTTVEAELFLDGAPVPPLEAGGRCGELEFTWRGLPRGVDGELDHRVTLRDASATWTIVNPFREVTATLLAPPAAVSPPLGSAGRVARGEAVVVGLDPPLAVVDASAALSSRVRHGEAPYELSVTSAFGSLELTVPATVPTDDGAFDLDVRADTELDRDACQGPPSCRGRSVFATWPVRIDD